MTTGDRSGGEGLEVRDLSVSLDDHEILRDLQLSVRRGEILALLGPSGCGKTTLLRTIAGLQPPAVGSVSWAGKDQRSVPAHRRRFGMVFQDHALLPHRNVGANVAFGLRMQKVPVPERRRRVAEMLGMVGLAGYERRGVATLSGGEAQRVALARALVTEPKLLLADEPFAALDRPLHDRLLADVRQILTELCQTAIHVTHDHLEAFALADTVALMRHGRIDRTATPHELRADPRDAWTADFLGLGTVWQPPPGSPPLTGTTIRTPWGPLRLDAATPNRPPTGPPAGTDKDAAGGGRCLLIRPEAVQGAGSGGVTATVSDIRVAGDRTIATFEVPGAPPLHGYLPASFTPASTHRIALDPAGVTMLRADP
ncbi:MAG: ABC transporter ATP-binding protein [Acidimicrobiia bacterium]|nr:ABC transporter ATP-binding protein [Acidimicrobiia bacterium]MYB23636.1 ABC transporter ATP-binding protein [Acidimicrobiia bacterium]